MKLIIYATLLVFSALKLAESSRILALIPIPSKSHGILMERLLNELSSRGHELVYIAATAPSKPIPNLKLIEIPDVRAQFLQAHLDGKTGLLAVRGMSPWVTLFMLPYMGPFICELVLKLPEVQEILNSNEHFDLILGEAFIDESVLAGFAYKFKAPIVAVSTFIANHWSNFLVGNPAPASYIPDPLLGLPTKMTFLQRLENYLYTQIGEIFHSMYYLPKQDAIVKKYFGNDVPAIDDILKNTSLVLVNYHQSLSFPRPYVPNMVDVGGFHINDPMPLPKDIQTYLDQSTKGAILFSLGTNVDSSEMDDQKISNILKALSRLEQNVLWKFGKKIENLPKNVQVGKWFPQSDILAHPNIKLFITHGGLLSTTESIFRGVPMVGIPLFGDQPVNMRNIEMAGLGKTVDFDLLSEELLYDTITEVVNNPNYKKATVEKSKLVQDNPISPLDNAVWWIEYVIRHKGAHHLRSASQDLSWYQYYLLDIYLVLTLGIIFVFYVFKKLLQRIFRRNKKIKQN